MAKKLLPLVLLSVPFLIFGQTIEDFNGVVDFTITLGDLDKVVASGNADGLTSRFVVIDGAVANREVINGDAEEYLGELELVSGEWIGVEKVVRYECILQLVGPQFASAIPARRSRRANPDEIQLNTRILTVAKAVGIRQREDGTYVPVLQAYYIRQIQ